MLLSLAVATVVGFGIFWGRIQRVKHHYGIYPGGFAYRGLDG